MTVAKSTIARGRLAEGRVSVDEVAIPPRKAGGISRRDFLKGSLAVAGAVALWGPESAWAYSSGTTLGADFVGPWGVAFSASGELFVSDPGAYQVLVFDPAGNLVRRIGRAGAGVGCLNYPTGIDISGDRLLVCDTNNGRVAVFGLDGAWHGSLGSLGLATAKLAGPTGVCGNDEKWIWVANTRGHVLQRYSWRDFRLDRAFGAFGDDAGPLNPGDIDFRLRLPTAVARDTAGRLCLLDSKHGRLLMLDLDGKLLWETHPRADSLPLSRPQAVIHHAGALYIADTGNDRLVKIKLDSGATQARRGVADPHGLAIGGGVIAVAQRRPRTVRLIEMF